MVVIQYRKEIEKRSIAMSKHGKKESRIIALAYLHRYGWLIGTVVCGAVFSRVRYLIFGIGLLLFAIWSFVGYKLRWKHIFCSYQSVYRRAIRIAMTPNNIRWGWVSKFDAYGVPIIILIFSVACLVYCCIFGLGK